MGFSIQEMRKTYIFKKQELEKQTRLVAKEIRDYESILIEHCRRQQLNDSCKIVFSELAD